MITAMFFTPWAAVGGLFVAGVALALRNWAAAALAAAATLYLAAVVLPRAVGGEAVRPEERETLTVLAANVYLGQADAAALVELVDRYRPDVLTVQELTPEFAGRLDQAGIDRRLPSAVLLPQPGGRGGGVYARGALTPLPLDGPTFFRSPRAALRLPGGRPVRLVGVHPPPPNYRLEDWHEGLRSLPTAGSGAPWVLAGDFNSTLDQAEFRDVVDRGYRDAGAATSNGLEPTWPGSARSIPGLITIDHVLADRRLDIAEYGVDDLPGSDHRAVHARLVLP